MVLALRAFAPKPVRQKMKVIQFVLAVFVAAVLIVGVVDLVGQPSAESPPAAGTPPAPPPVHAFIPSGGSADDRISCPVASGLDMREVFARPPSRCWLVDGFSGAHEWGRWVKRPAARFEIHLENPGDHELVLRAKAPPGLSANTRQAVEVTVNGRFLATRTIDDRYGNVAVPVPSDALRAGANEFSLAFDHLVPAVMDERGQVGISKAAAIGGITLVDPIAAPVDSPEEHVAVCSWDSSRRSLALTRPGTLILPVSIPPGAEHMNVDLRATLDNNHEGASIRMALSGVGEAFRRGTTMKVPPARSLTLIRHPVAGLGGGRALLSVHHDVPALELTISQPRFEGGAISRQRRRPENGSEPDRRPPDIVWITLDAARADHFGLAGYHRDTTPFIDRLAAESLVFPNATSLAPYTVCSVPTMLSGLSFLDHRVVGPDDVLSPEVVTLAERLAMEGYLTAAFTATPNNSASRGFDQGYEVFREMWTEGETRVTRRAPFIASRVVEWLETIENDHRPLHLQVHIIPPHEPYDPPPEFDRYTDPAYRGPCDGFSRTNFKLTNGILAPTPECIDHVTGLYDGNLNVADDAVRTIVQALQRRPSWDNTVLLVTSDHGEAFMEHGQIGHNSTLYTEMMHVPFILRMPAGFDAQRVDTESMVTLADLVPTLLHAAGLEPPLLTDGVDLLNPAVERSHRVMVARTSKLQPTLGLRTARWNLMVSSSGSAALYDLAGDPDERSNLSAEQPEVFLGLGRILTSRLDAPPMLSAERAGELDAEERRLLETLGYISD
ncbi:MAG: sulfatase [Thermoanaerobaculales bacterium]|jgi:arylsulfatase|nr:sulfatase [Thermoanaerobaculales bacterium]